MCDIISPESSLGVAEGILLGIQPAAAELARIRDRVVRSLACVGVIEPACALFANPVVVGYNTCIRATLHCYNYRSWYNIRA